MGLLRMIQTVVSQHPGCVVEPSYVMKCSVSGSILLRDKCFIGVEAPGIRDKKYIDNKCQLGVGKCSNLFACFI